MVQPNKTRKEIQAVTMPMFPRAETLQGAVDLAESQLPITDKNDLFILLMVYHNTLLDQYKRGKE